MSNIVNIKQCYDRRNMIKSAPLRLAVKALVNVGTVWGMNVYFPSYFTVFGGLPAYVIIGCLLTLLNLFLRPIMSVITFPLHLLFTLFTTILVNSVFLAVVYLIVIRMDPNIVVMTITDGITGWVIVSSVLGFVNWAMKHML